ncbi:unnamed protein product, partial [marine sediment metagenome]
AIFITKYLPERLYKLLDFFFADNDGINSYENRSAWNYDEAGLKELYRSLGINKIYTFMDECLGIWEG